MNELEPLTWNAHTTPSALVAQCRTLHDSSSPLLILLDRREPASTRVCEDCLDFLSPQELERHHSFRQSADRERFVLGRSMLRLLLGAWLGQSASEVGIEIGPYGKPFCPGGPEFNISHSGDLILLGLHPCQPVGIDVEQIQPSLEWEPIARHLWPDEVIEGLKHLPDQDQCSAFVQYWCQYEAMNKASGRGLVAALPFDPHHQNCVIWRVLLAGGYRGAAALLQPMAGGNV